MYHPLTSSSSRGWYLPKTPTIKLAGIFRKMSFGCLENLLEDVGPAFFIEFNEYPSFILWDYGFIYLKESWGDKILSNGLTFD